MSSARPAATRAERWGWAVLGALLALLMLAAATVHRARWPSLMGDEATYLMAAESLAWDLDLLYERADFERFVAHWGIKPEGLILQSGDHGRTLAFGKPFFYSLYLAPFVRWSPTQGPFVANVLLLAVAAWTAAGALRDRLGAAAPAWTAAFLFASVAFTYVFWAHADVFLLSLSALALALAFRERAEVREGAARAVFLRWLLVGLLMAVVIFSRPLYAPLLLPAALAALRWRRRAVWAGLAAGVVGLVAGAVAVHQSTASAWTSYDAERGGFYSSTGFPVVDFPREGWDDAIHRSGNVAWGSWMLSEDGDPLDRTRLWLWNALYLLVGRNVGLLPYYLPALLLLLAPPRGWSRWALVAAIVVSVSALLFIRPHNFYGGGAAIGNRYFLALYPALWFAASRRRGALWALVAALAAAPFLWPLWAQGSAYPKTAQLTYRFVSPLAQRALPYETTQSHLKPAGREDVVHNDLWIKMLSPRTSAPAEDELAVAAGARAELLIGSAEPVGELRLTVIDGDAVPEVRGAELARPAAGRGYLLRLRGPRARHPMWWTVRSVHLYRLDVAFDGDGGRPVRFSLAPAGETAE